MKTKLYTLALAALTVGLLGSCEKDNGHETLQQNLLAGALSGKFTVNAKGKQVYFSKGNLYADGDKALHFEANQYDSANSLNVSHVSHFTWSTTVAGAVGSSASKDYLFFFCDERHKVSVDGSDAIYYALSYYEWTYLFNTRTVNGGTGAGKSYSLNIIYGGKRGVVLYPDNYAGSVLSGRVDSLPEGVVFLPAAGLRRGSFVDNVGVYGYYWSSTTKNQDSAYSVYFGSDYVNPSNSVFRILGYSVRLVTESK